jgi:predicted NBD/HSP70 family sugar kinase
MDSSPITKEGMGNIRKSNTRKRILQLIRERGKISKTELKHLSRYSMETVLSTINDLLADNLIFYAEKGNTFSGRKPTYISLNPGGGYFVGISFNATDIRGAILNYCGEIIYSVHAPLSGKVLSVEYVLECLKKGLLQMLEAHKDKKKLIYGIGIGVPGYLNEKTNMSIFYPHIPNWKNVDIAGFFRAIIPDINIFIENSTNAMALAYKWLRPEFRGMNYIIIVIRSGVRMAGVFGDMLYKGKNYTAGEIGHVQVSGSRRYCPCGKYGCLDSEASEIAIRERIIEGIKVNRYHWIWDKAKRKFDNVNIELFIQGVLEGDKDCNILLDEVCNYLGEAITRLLNILDPEKIILTSRLNQIGDLFLNRLRKYIAEHAVFVALENFSLEATDFGETLAEVGAAAIVMERELAYVDAII